MKNNRSPDKARSLLQGLGLGMVLTGIICALLSGILGYFIFSTMAWIFISLAVGFVGYLLLANAAPEAGKLSDDQFDWLLKNGIVVEVNLANCKISDCAIPKGNHNIDYTGGWMEGARIVVAGASHERENGCSSISYVHKLASGKNTTFRQFVSLDPKTLEIKCMIQKSTRIYYRPDNVREFYFDLQFLK